ncbi:phosphoribosylamine--glycine ligase [Dichotomicrobium thermohalophilum]|uniref:Phosphoribosylamine--glycine ligase n=1 Tax=Dichotomicrobium thermohalophilum TaxID=933063 RepID=A0A397PMN1_9HYPH|nr:phosphoribosylamine--glycine ligase [Dichotomicrobium thermohalophilum]RIA47374.1 phosphoribosylamine--glycine ligase [Dichotomicrobium thermohalophilum]
MKVLLIGSGAREHALGWALSKSPVLTQLYCAPGNPGLAEIGECVALDVDGYEDIVAFCREETIDLVVVGPEAPLVAGLGDALEAAGIRVFGPSKAAAQLEGSKRFTKDLCAEAGIPTADYAAFDTAEAARAHLKERALPVVIKADGLAAGKGVAVAKTQHEAEAAIDACFSGAFGQAGAQVVIEDCLQGEEASFFAIVDGETVLPLVAAQDHKRAFDGDTGPNTGGMGAYSPAKIMSPAMCDRVMDEIITPTVKAMAARATPYRGVLYAGLMITADGPRLIEYNVRFGDPEAQVLMMRLQSDLLPVLLAACDGRLHEADIAWRAETALTVVMATRGYPGAYEKGSEIRGVEDAAGMADVEVFHAGTKREGGKLIASGGRVLSVTALGKTVREAHARAYEAVSRIDWPAGFYRQDIGWRDVVRETAGEPANGKERVDGQG